MVTVFAYMLALLPTWLIIDHAKRGEGELCHLFTLFRASVRFEQTGTTPLVVVFS